MVDAGTASLSIAGFFTLCSLLVFIVAIKQANNRGASYTDNKHMLIGMFFSLPLIFLFWAMICMFSIWFTIHVLGWG